MDPSCTFKAPTMPPVGCCTFLTFESTTIEPCAISAPEIFVTAVHPPKPRKMATSPAPPTSECRRIDLLASNSRPISIAFISGLPPRQHVKDQAQRRVSGPATGLHPSDRSLADARLRVPARSPRQPARTGDGQ